MPGYGSVTDALNASHILPPSADKLFESAGRKNLFTSKPWFEAFLAAGLTPGA